MAPDYDNPANDISGRRRDVDSRRQRDGYEGGEGGGEVSSH